MHPKIGDFSIEYTQAGGVNGNKEDGLHHPVIKMANLNNWEPINVDAIIDSSSGGHGNLCKKSHDGIHPSIHYQCVIPEKGRVAFGLSNLSPADPVPGFTPGWCTMHIAQHQRNEYGIGPDYAFDVVLFDNAKKVIGSTQRAGIDGNTKILSFTSYLTRLRLRRVEETVILWCSSTVIRLGTATIRDTRALYARDHDMGMRLETARVIWDLLAKV